MARPKKSEEAVEITDGKIKMTILRTVWEAMTDKRWSVIGEKNIPQIDLVDPVHTGDVEAAS